MLKPRWKYVQTELGTGIECTGCGHKIKAIDVTMGEYDLNTCPFCEKKMMPIEQKLLNRLKEESIHRW